MGPSMPSIPQIPTQHGREFVRTGLASLFHFRNNEYNEGVGVPNLE